MVKVLNWESLLFSSLNKLYYKHSGQWTKSVHLIISTTLQYNFMNSKGKRKEIKGIPKDNNVKKQLKIINKK